MHLELSLGDQLVALQIFLKIKVYKKDEKYWCYSSPCS